MQLSINVFIHFCCENFASFKLIRQCALLMLLYFVYYYFLFATSQEPEEIFEEDYYSVVVQTEEDIYQDLCYIDRQTQKVLLFKLLLFLLFILCDNLNIFMLTSNQDTDF